MCPVEMKLQARKWKFVTQLHEINDSFSEVVHVEFNMREILDFPLWWQHRQTWLTSSHNLTQITTKILQNKHHWEPSEIDLNRSLDNYGFNEITSTQTGRTGCRSRRGWPHVHLWWMKILEGYLRSEKSQPHNRPPSPEFQCQEDQSSQLLAAKPVEIESVNETSGASVSSS